MYTGLARKFIQVFPIKWYGKTHTNFLANSVPRKEITGLYSNSMFNFLRKHQIVLKARYHFTFPPAMHKGSNFSTSFQTLVIFLFFFLKWLSQGMQCFISHTPSGVSVWFSFAFPQWLKPFSIFSCVYWPFGFFFFWEMSVMSIISHLSILKLDGLSICCWAVSSLYILRTRPFSGIWLANIYSQFGIALLVCELSFHFLDSIFWCWEVLNFVEIKFIYFIFCCLYFWCRIYESIAKQLLKSWRFSPVSF